MKTLSSRSAAALSAGQTGQPAIYGAVGIEERPLGEVAPSQRAFEPLRRRLVLVVLQHAGPGRIVERAQHAGHVLERRALGAAVGDRLRRLAFEIENEDVAVGDQDLAEMIVAVQPGLGEPFRRQGEHRQAPPRPSGAAPGRGRSRRHRGHADRRAPAPGLNSLPPPAGRASLEPGGEIFRGHPLLRRRRRRRFAARRRDASRRCGRPSSAAVGL